MSCISTYSFFFRRFFAFDDGINQALVVTQKLAVEERPVEFFSHSLCPWKKH